MAFTDQRFLCVGEVEGSVDVEQRSNYASRKIITHFSLACFLFQLLGQIIWCSLTSIGAGGKGQIMTTYLDSVMDMRAQVCTQLFHPPAYEWRQQTWARCFVGAFMHLLLLLKSVKQVVQARASVHSGLDHITVFSESCCCCSGEAQCHPTFRI